MAFNAHIAGQAMAVHFSSPFGARAFGGDQALLVRVVTGHAGNFPVTVQRQHDLQLLLHLLHALNHPG